MRYTLSTLAPDEEILAIGRFHWTYTFVSFLWLILLGWALIGLYIFLRRTIKRNTTELAVTNHRFIYKRGLISRYTDELTTSRILHVTLVQGFWGRLLGYGQIIIHSADVGKFGLPTIAKPLVFRRALIESGGGTTSSDPEPEDIREAA